MFVFLLVFLIACSEVDAPRDTIQNTVQIIQNISAHPEKTADLCTELNETEHKEQCFLIGLDLLSTQSVEKTEVLCQKIPKSFQEECFFRLAERSLSQKHCLRLEDLRERCLMHILNRRIVEKKITSFAEGIAVVTQNSLPLNRGTYNVIYHYLLSKHKTVHIDQCQAEKYPDICEEAAIILFLKRLRELEVKSTAPCLAITNFPHFEHPRLKAEQEYFMKKNCLE